MGGNKFSATGVFLKWVKSRNIKKKTDILDALLVALERLLPDQCGVCKNVYTIDREDSPTLQCSGCQQGFHQECLDTMMGSSTMPVFPGHMYWLCELSAPKYSLMTVVGEAVGLWGFYMQYVQPKTEH